MREHPIPQDITSYRFHLIGNMTLKQFAEILAGFVIAFIIFKSGLPNIIRLPFAFFFAGLGTMAAFVPIEERPLDHWIVTFFKALFKPTKFYWKREPQVPDLFFYKPSSDSIEFQGQTDLSPARKNRVYQFLQSINQTKEDTLDEFDQAQQQKIGSILSQFDQLKVTVQSSTKELVKPSLKVRIRQIRNLGENSVSAIKPSIPTPQPTTTFFKMAAPRDGAITSVKTTPQPKTTEEPSRSINLPETQVATGQVAGTVLSASNQLVTDALIEVKDTEGKTITAVNSNSLGQFFISQQLPLGTYSLVTVAPDSKFEPQQITLGEDALDPVEIKAVQ
jgi:hypothetical protein